MYGVSNVAKFIDFMSRIYSIFMFNEVIFLFNKVAFIMFIIIWIWYKCTFS